MKKIYIAIPYRGIEDIAFELATLRAAQLTREGNLVFSPITHGHPMSKYNLPKDWSYWKSHCESFLEWAEELEVLVPNGDMGLVQRSEGCVAEVAYAVRNMMKITYTPITK